MKTYRCDYEECSLTYSTKYNLRRHIANFHQGMRHSCSICGKQLSSAQSLQDHEYCHTGEKPYHCKYPGCSKRYRQASQLSVHKRKHKTRVIKKPRRFQKLAVNYFKIKLCLLEGSLKQYQVPSGPFTIADANLPPLLNPAI